eukprot:6173297-Pleurochrysis_carterae.AAC.6
MMGSMITRSEAEACRRGQRQGVWEVGGVLMKARRRQDNAKGYVARLTTEDAASEMVGDGQRTTFQSRAGVQGQKKRNVRRHAHEGQPRVQKCSGSLRGG